jgi:hypothetical protein
VEYRAVKITSRDNVAVVVQAVPRGEPVIIATDKTVLKLSTNEDIPAGHKIALTPIKQGSAVVRYGETIGTATRSIRKGDWIHTTI